jgi:transcriptional regulator with XRE-family HTH domain
MSRKPRYRIDMRELRTRSGLTQQQVTEALRIAMSTLQYWESGQRQPESGILPDIAKLFGCSIEELYGLPAPEGAPRKAK